MAEVAPVFVKLGGSVITDKTKPFTERVDAIARLAGEIRRAHSRTGLRLLIGHGGGSYPHTPARLYRTDLGLTDENSRVGIVLVQDAAARLNRIVVSYLLKEGINAISVQPSCNAVSKNGRIRTWDLRSVRLMLGLNLIPVVYGDVSMDLSKGCAILSTEELFRYLARRLRPSRVIVGSDVNGVYDRDPKTTNAARKIAVITPKNVKSILQSLESNKSVDVTGGMMSKVLTLLELARTSKVECEILDISKPGHLEAALNGKKGIGTIIRAS
ncbi:MAG: isopentenyl phosphate kinase [Candidatus Bathyarchaeia archaeon]